MKILDNLDNLTTGFKLKKNNMFNTLDYNKIEKIIHTPRVWENQQKPDPNNRGENWNVTGNGVNWLYGLYDMILENFIENSILVEIGAFSGTSTMLFACVCKQVYAIDPWTDYKSYTEINPQFLHYGEQLFDARMKHFQNVKKIKSKSVDAVCQFENESLDVVYIDGEHKYDSVIQDIKLWLPKIKNGGLLCGHDYIENDIKNALNVMFPTYKFNMYWDSSWIYKKI